MLVPQLEIQPFVPGAAVPGLPVDVLVQKSGVVPHCNCGQSGSSYCGYSCAWRSLTCPQTLQQAFRGHGFKVERSVPAAGSAVPGT